MEKGIVNLEILTRYINVDTPFCVLNFFAKIANIVFNKTHWGNTDYISDFISAFKQKLFTIPENFPTEDPDVLSKCLKLLNPYTEEQWSVNGINDGMRSLLPYLYIPFTSDIRVGGSV